MSNRELPTMEEAFFQWQQQHDVQLVDLTKDALYNYNPEANKERVNSKYWVGKDNFFQRVCISAIALMKMSIHAESGSDLEVMGMMRGYVDQDAFVITDVMPLPVEGTETRVNAHDEANEYIIQYLNTSQSNGREEHIIGWYHSHPGYGCWLSGIDVTTQELQQHQGPFVAVVIDPHRSAAAGKVEIGAFRTLTYAAESIGKDKAITSRRVFIPSEKEREFGVHAHKYYPLTVTYFMSTLDNQILENLWKKYWVQTLADKNRISSELSAATAGLIENATNLTRTVDSCAFNTSYSTTKMRNVADDVDALAEKGRSLAYLEQIGVMGIDVKKNLFMGLGFASLKKEDAQMTE